MLQWKNAELIRGKMSFLTTSMIVHTQNAKGPADQSVTHKTNYILSKAMNN